MAAGATTLLLSPERKDFEYGSYLPKSAGACGLFEFEEISGDQRRKGDCKRAEKQWEGVVTPVHL